MTRKRRPDPEPDGETEGVPIFVSGTLIAARGWRDPDEKVWVPVEAVYLAMPRDWQSSRRVGQVTPAQTALELELIAGATSRRVPALIRDGVLYVAAISLLRWGIHPDWTSTAAVYLEPAA